MLAIPNHMRAQYEPIIFYVVFDKDQKRYMIIPVKTKSNLKLVEKSGIQMN